MFHGLDLTIPDFSNLDKSCGFLLIFAMSGQKVQVFCRSTDLVWRVGGYHWQSHTGQTFLYQRVGWRTDWKRRGVPVFVSEGWMVTALLTKRRNRWTNSELGESWLSKIMKLNIPPTFPLSGMCRCSFARRWLPWGYIVPASALVFL